MREEGMSDGGEFRCGSCDKPIPTQGWCAVCAGKIAILLATLLGGGGGIGLAIIML